MTTPTITPVSLRPHLRKPFVLRTAPFLAVLASVFVGAAGAVPSSHTTAKPGPGTLMLHPDAHGTFTVGYDEAVDDVALSIFPSPVPASVCPPHEMSTPSNMDGAAKYFTPTEPPDGTSKVELSSANSAGVVAFPSGRLKRTKRFGFEF
jgi:hypothetical protein